MRRTAILALVALLVGGCAGGEPQATPGDTPPAVASSPTASPGDGSEPSPSEEPSPSAEPSDPSVPSATVIALGDSRQLGRGYVEGYSRDGRWLLVQIEEHQEGCEGAPTLRLKRMDVDTGELADAVVGTEGVVTGTLLRGGDQDRVVILDSCEGYLVDLWIGTEEADGTIRDVVAFGDGLRDEDLAWWTLAWDHTGQTLTVADGVFADPDQPRDLLRLDPRTGTLRTVLTTEHFDAAEQVGPDAYLLVRGGTLVRVEDGQERDAYPQSDGSYAVAPGGATLALASDDGLWVLDDGGLRQLTDRAAWALAWSPDARLLAFLSLDDPGNFEEAVHLWLVAADGRTDPVQVSTGASAGAGFSAGALSPAGDQLAYTAVVFDTTGYEVGEVTIVDLVVTQRPVQD